MNVSDFFRKLTDNWPAKLLSLAIAVLLYLSNQMMSLETKTLAVPLSVSQTGEFVITNSIPKFIKVTVKTTPENITHIVASDITVTVHTEQFLKSGVHDMPIDLDLSESLIILDPFEIDIEKKTVSVRLEKKISRYVSLSPQYEGELPHGYQVSSCTFEPAKVTILGIESQVNAVSHLVVNGIDLSSKKDSFSTPVIVENFSNAITLRKPESVIATVKILPSYVTKRIDAIETSAVNLLPSLEIKKDLPSIAIDLYGKELDLDNYEASSITAQFDFTGIEEPGSYEIPLRLYFLNRFKLVSIIPSSISATVSAVAVIESDETVESEVVLDDEVSQE